MSEEFKIESPFEPAGDQPQAIGELVAGLKRGDRNQVLLGVTGSGKTFTMAKIIETCQRPALIMAPNKILAAQLYSEMKEFFPHNHVEYFVSYYDYYQPEAYIPKTDTYIEKDSAINEQIDRMRNSATRSILESRDVIIVASVSCIYGLGDVASYSAMTLELKTGDEIEPQDIYRRLSELQYERNQLNFVRSTFRVQGDTLDIFPAHLEDRAWRVSFFGDEIESICREFPGCINPERAADGTTGIAVKHGVKHDVGDMEQDFGLPEQPVIACAPGTFALSVTDVDRTYDVLGLVLLDSGDYARSGGYGSPSERA